MRQNRIKVFGPPGTGKTTWCLDTLGHHIEAGDRVLFASFTRAAADEGRSRLRTLFGDVPANATCGTIHSMCLRFLNVPKDCLFEQRDVKWKFYHKVDRLGLSNEKIAATLELYQRLRNEECYNPELIEFAKRNPEDFVDIFESVGLKRLFIERYEQYKTQDARVDFTDLLTRVANGEGTIPQYDVVIIDEAQDLTRLQWRVMERICATVPHTVYAVGDDDQSIYEFLGADVEYFLKWPCTSVRVLDTTYRLPQNFLDYSLKVVGRISNRQEKKIQTSVTGNGLIHEGFWTENMPFYRHPTELYLVRNNFMLNRVQSHLVTAGLPFKGSRSPWMRYDVQSIGTLLAWKDSTLDKAGWKGLKRYMAKEFVEKIEHSFPAIIERNSDAVIPELNKLFPKAFFEDRYQQWWRRFYPNMPVEIKSMVLKGFSTFKPELCLNPTLEVTSIHRAKGKEADCVYVSSGLTDKIRRKLTSEDTEHRVFYVAVTRAKKELFLISDLSEREQYPVPQP